MTVAAVLFDMDGTLVDTEDIWEIAIRDLAAHYGGVLSPQARRAMLGASAAATMSLLFDDLDQPWRDPVEGTAWLHRRVAELFAIEIPWRPGARELLALLRAGGVRTALVTNTDRPLVDVVLGTIGAANFDHIVCGDEVTRTKPHPEPYLTAAAALGVDPAHCVAIEDSPTGVESALAAGCAVIAVPHAVPLDEVLLGSARGHQLASLLEVDLTLLRLLAVPPSTPVPFPSI